MLRFFPSLRTWQPLVLLQGLLWMVGSVVAVPVAVLVVGGCYPLEFLTLPWRRWHEHRLVPWDEPGLLSEVLSYPARRWLLASALFPYPGSFLRKAMFQLWWNIECMSAGCQRLDVRRQRFALWSQVLLTWAKTPDRVYLSQMLMLSDACLALDLSLKHSLMEMPVSSGMSWQEKAACAERWLEIAQAEHGYVPEALHKMWALLMGMAFVQEGFKGRAFSALSVPSGWSQEQEAMRDWKTILTMIQAYAQSDEKRRFLPTSWVMVLIERLKDFRLEKSLILAYAEVFQSALWGCPQKYQHMYQTHQTLMHGEDVLDVLNAYRDLQRMMPTLDSHTYAKMFWQRFLKKTGQTLDTFTALDIDRQKMRGWMTMQAHQLSRDARESQHFFILQRGYQALIAFEQITLQCLLDDDTALSKQPEWEEALKALVHEGILHTHESSEAWIALLLAFKGDVHMLWEKDPQGTEDRLQDMVRQRKLHRIVDVVRRPL